MNIQSDLSLPLYFLQDSTPFWCKFYCWLPKSYKYFSVWKNIFTIIPLCDWLTVQWRDSISMSDVFNFVTLVIRLTVKRTALPTLHQFNKSSWKYDNLFLDHETTLTMIFLWFWAELLDGCLLLTLLQSLVLVLPRHKHFKPVKLPRIKIRMEDGGKTQST